MKKETFIKVMGYYQKQMEYDEEFAETLGELYKDSYPGNLFYDNGVLYEGLLNMLEECFEDVGEWIRYFIYELNFGKDFKMGMVTEGDKNYDLSDINKLYDFLVENQKNAKK